MFSSYEHLIPALPPLFLPPHIFVVYILDGMPDGVFHIALVGLPQVCILRLGSLGFFFLIIDPRCAHTHRKCQKKPIPRRKEAYSWEKRDLYQVLILLTYLEEAYSYDKRGLVLGLKRPIQDKRDLLLG